MEIILPTESDLCTAIFFSSNYATHSIFKIEIIHAKSDFMHWCVWFHFTWVEIFPFEKKTHWKLKHVQHKIKIHIRKLRSSAKSTYLIWNKSILHIFAFTDECKWKIPLIKQPTDFCNLKIYFFINNNLSLNWTFVPNQYL